jgi:hypothetical protein
MHDSDLPHRTKICEEILGKAAKVKDILKEKYKVCCVLIISPVNADAFLNDLQHIPGQISITLDAWTSNAYDPYLAVTAHYIESPLDQLTKWSLKTDLLGFTEIKGNHGGANQAAIVLHIVDCYNIHDKVGLMSNIVVIYSCIKTARMGNI